MSAVRPADFNTEITKAQGALRRAFNTALDVLLPARCPGCGADGTAGHGLLCAACFQATTFISAPFCSRCGVPFAASAMGSNCEACVGSAPRFAQARAALRYDDGARRLVLPLKHADRTELAEVLARLMLRAGAEMVVSSDVIVPVPLHRARLRRRKYNQAGLLARGVARAAGRPGLGA